MAVVVMDKAPYHVRLKAPALKDLGKKTRDELIEVVRKVGFKRQMWRRRPRQLRRVIYKPLFSPSDPNCFCAPAFFDQKKYIAVQKISHRSRTVPVATAPAEGLAWLHDRQPVVLRGEAAAREWLRRGDRPDVYARLTRGTAEGLTYHMVNPAIGKASEWQGPEACAPYTPPKPKRAGADIRGFFSAAPSPKRRAGGRDAADSAQHQQEEAAPPQRAELEREH